MYFIVYKFDQLTWFKLIPRNFSQNSKMKHETVSGVFHSKTRHEQSRSTGGKVISSRPAKSSLDQ